MQKITPFLWFDNQAKEAAEFYVSAYGKGSTVKNISRLDNTPSGSVEIATFELLGREFQAISAGPLFKFNPSVSFHVICKTKDEVDAIWKRLSEGGTVLMELGAYPFSERYGWVQDKYGLSWQIIFFGGAEVQPKITPVIMFVGGVCGKAEEAVNFWASVFREAKVDNILRYGKGEGPDKEGTVKYAAFSLLDQEFGALDSAHKHPFAFNEAISFVINCKTQEEVDSYWEKLTQGGQASQCGWLKDPYGLSWQVVPTVLDEMLQDKDPKKSERVMQAMLQMKKIDIKTLRKAYEQK